MKTMGEGAIVKGCCDEEGLQSCANEFGLPPGNGTFPRDAPGESRQMEKAPDIKSGLKKHLNTLK